MKFDKSITPGEVAEYLDAEISGDADISITGINEIHMVEPGDITFVDHPKYYNKVLASAASLIIINKKTEAPEGKALIFCNDPFSAYVKLVEKHRKFTPAKVMVSPVASIGKGSIIQPGAFIADNVTIGENCLIHANVCIYEHSIIGNNVEIHSNSVIGADAFYYKKREKSVDKLVSCGRVVLHDHVEIGACTTIDKGVSGDTVIGEYSKLDNHIQIGHDTRIGARCFIGAHVGISGVTIVEDDVTIWGQTGVQKDIIIGKGAIVLARSGVDKSLEPGKIYFGAPAREARSVWKEMALSKRLPEVFEKLGL